MLWSYDHVVKLKLNKVLSVYTVVSGISYKVFTRSSKRPALARVF